MRPWVFAVGGTGGHLLPALALKKRLQGPVWLLGKGLKKHVLTEGLADCIEITSANNNPVRLAFGFFQSLWHLLRLRPRAVVGFGSYHSLPVCLAALALGIPLHLYEYNVRAGRVSRWLSRFAVSSGVVFEQTNLKGVVHIVEPLLVHGKRAARSKAADYFGLDPSKKTLLIFGGSQGAAFLNSVAEKIASFEKTWQVVHLTGANKVCGPVNHWSVRSFEERMDLAWSLADLALCRAGAGTICEARAYGVYALFVPYRYAGGHQKANAELMEQLGCGECMEESRGQEVIAERVVELMEREKMPCLRPHAAAPRFEEAVLQHIGLNHNASKAP